MMGYRTVGNTLAEWDDATPFIFRLSENVGSEDTPHFKTVTIDLSDLQQGFSRSFLQNLKDLLIERRHRVLLITIEKSSRKIKNLLHKIIALRMFDSEINMIDEAFLLALYTVAEKMSERQLATLKAMFLASPHSPLWGPCLNAGCFPQKKDKKGRHGQQISRILAKALTRSACVHILSRCEQAYDLGEIDIGLFSFVNLAFAVFCRPESYRKIQLNDLIFDKESNSYFIYIFPAKSGVRKPKKIAYKINDALGILLQKQRQNVVDQYSHLVAPEYVSKLALFPARRLNADKSAWLHKDANELFGMYSNPEAFAAGYSQQLQQLFSPPGLTLGANVLRHTVGTQLAQTGASSRTIQAVLKHATDIVCKAYVDIAFHGLIEALSDSMQPAFDKHLPVFTKFRSKSDPVDSAQAIRSDDLETGRVELTGECGKLIQCEYAPITCYGCARFIPCWDADHSINLITVQREIEDYKQRGKAFEHRVKSALDAKYQIILVMNAADRYRQGCTQETHS